MVSRYLKRNKNRTRRKFNKTKGGRTNSVEDYTKFENVELRKGDIVGYEDNGKIFDIEITYIDKIGYEIAGLISCNNGNVQIFYYHDVLKININNNIYNVIGYKRNPTHKKVSDTIASLVSRLKTRI